jgi:hypothetical protein
MNDLKKEELQKLYDTMTNKEICEKLKISKPTLHKFLKVFGIEKKNKEAGIKKFNLIKND